MLSKGLYGGGASRSSGGTGAAEDVVGVFPEHRTSEAASISSVVKSLELAAGGKEVIHKPGCLKALSSGESVKGLAKVSPSNGVEGFFSPGNNVMPGGCLGAFNQALVHGWAWAAVQMYWGCWM